jgi:hypothetical protein
MQEAAYEFPRINLPRTSLNNGRRRGRSVEAPASFRLWASLPSLARQRGAHGPDLRAPERSEGIRISHGRGDLRVYGHRRRALPVGAGRHELGEAKNVARVAPNGPAPRLVAEYAQPGRVLPRPKRIGGSPLDDLALLRSGTQVVEPSLHVAADEGIEVGRGGDDASRGPEPAGGERLADVLWRLLGEVVAVDEGLPQVGADRKGGPPEPQRPVDLLL